MKKYLHPLDYHFEEFDIDGVAAKNLIKLIWDNSDENNRKVIGEYLNIEIVKNYNISSVKEILDL